MARFPTALVAAGDGCVRLPAVILVVLVAGCGGSKKAAAAQPPGGRVRLTTAMRTWKQNGQRAAKIAGQTVKGFEALTPPDSLVGASLRGG